MILTTEPKYVVNNETTTDSLVKGKIRSAKIRWQGISETGPKTYYQNTSNYGVGSASFPSLLSGYTCTGSSWSAGASFQCTGGTGQFRLAVNTPFGTKYSSWQAITAGETKGFQLSDTEITCESGSIEPLIITDGVTGNVVDRNSRATTTGSMTVTETTNTSNPSVRNLGDWTTGQVGSISNNAWSAWRDIPNAEGLTTLTLLHSIEGTEKANYELEIDYISIDGLVKVAGAWITIDEGWVKVNGVWEPIEEIVPITGGG